MRSAYIAAAASLAMLFAPAFPAGAMDEDVRSAIEELKQEMMEMSSRYESRIAELEARLVQQERKVPEAHSHFGADGTDVHHVLGLCQHHGLLGDRVKAIGALDGRYLKVDSGKNTLFLHEAKAGAQADITDWLFGFITFTKHHGSEVEIEEAYARLRFEEAGLSAKPGKFFVNFGPENQAHFFDRRTITLSAMHDGIFGHEPWADTGVQFDWRLPVDFYSDLCFAVVNGDNASTFGDGSSDIPNNNLPLVANWTNAFETDYGFFRLGPSLSWGQWDMDDKYNVYLAGGDIYYKLGNFDAQAELIYRYKEQMPGVKEENTYGYYSWGAYTFPVRYKYLRAIEFLAGFGQFIPDIGTRETRVTPQIGFVINDYAKVRATYEVREFYPKGDKENRFIAQFALAF